MLILSRLRRVPAGFVNFFFLKAKIARATRDEIVKSADVRRRETRKRDLRK